MDAQKDDSHDRCGSLALIRCLDAAGICAQCEHVHAEGNSRNAEKHERGPYSGRRNPRMAVACNDFVASEVVLGDGEGEDTDHDGIEDQGNDARYELEDADCALVFLANFSTEPCF